MNGSTGNPDRCITRRRVNTGVLGALAGVTLGSQASGATSGTSLGAGSETEDDEVVLIEDWYDLADIDSNDDTSDVYRLENDLSESNPGYDDVVGSDGEKWESIGGFLFDAVFDGNGHTIRDFVVSDSGTSVFPTFFEGIDNDGEVKDVRFKSVSFIDGYPVLAAFNGGRIENVEVEMVRKDGSGSGDIEGLQGFTAFSETNQGEIVDCEVDVDFEVETVSSGFVSTNSGEGLIKDSTVTGTIVVDGEDAAGVAVENNGEISGVTVDAELRAVNVGGVAVENRGTIRESLVSGDVFWEGSSSVDNSDVLYTGGISAMNLEDGTVEECVVDGEVGFSDNRYPALPTIGGVCGMNQSVVRDCRNEGFVTGVPQESTGGIAGVNQEGGEVKGCLKMGSVSVLSEGGNLVGHNDGSLLTSYFEDAADLHSREAVATGTDGGERIEAKNMAGERAEATLTDLEDVWSFPTDPPLYPQLDWEEEEAEWKRELTAIFYVELEDGLNSQVSEGGIVTLTPIDNDSEAIIEEETDEHGTVSAEFLPGLVELSMTEQVDDEGNIDEDGSHTVSWEEEVFVRPNQDSTTGYPATELQSDCSPPPLGHYENPPQDLNGDGLFEDVTGTGEGVTIADVQALFDLLDDKTLQENSKCFNFSGTDEGSVSIFDVQALFQRL